MDTAAMTACSVLHRIKLRAWSITVSTALCEA